MTNQPWLDLVGAVRAVRDARGPSDGAACTLLRQGCESGMVRSRKRPWPEQPDEPPESLYDHWSPPIPKEDWHRASIDLSHGWLILAGDKLLRAHVEINVDDLNYWLKSQRAAPNREKSVGKRSRVRKLLAVMFPDGVPHAGDCPRKVLQAELLERDRSLGPLDLATLKLAIDEYNDDPIRSDRIVSE
jgi:hypothetical protein